MGKTAGPMDKHTSIFSVTSRALACATWVVLAGVLATGCRQESSLRVVIRETDPVLDLAANEVAARLQPEGYQVGIATGPQASAGQVQAIILNSDPSAAGLEPEGYQVIPMRVGGFWLVRITGHDARGTLWGALDVAEQIASQGRLEALQATTQNRFLPIRAIRVPLPLPDRSLARGQRMQARDLWRQYFELLARSRLNSVFFLAQQPLASFVNIAEQAATSPSQGESNEASAQWLRELFQLARERGLAPYLALGRPALEELIATQRAATFPGALVNTGLPQVLPAVFASYPELAGAMLEEDLLQLAGPGENRSRWLAANFLPLLATGEKHSVFMNVGNEQWPSPETFAGVEPSVVIRLVAAWTRVDQVPDRLPYPVLWQVSLDSPELLPWQDPQTIAAVLARMNTPRSAGFVDDVYAAKPADGEQNTAVESYLPPPTQWQWFRFLLLGRMGYDRNFSETYWRQQFASRFGARAGPSVTSAASSASQLLQLLHEWNGNGLVAASGQSALATVSQAASNRLLQALATNVLAQNGWLVETRQEIATKTAEPSVVADTLEQQARVVLDEVERATRLGAWKASALMDFRLRIERIAASGLAHAEYLRAVSALAQFFLGGAEADRRQAIAHLQQARKTLGADDAGSPLSARINQAIESSAQWEPWLWEKTDWQVGVVPEWKSDSSGVIPSPPQWQSVQTLRLAEFGNYGRQPWMTSLNQQLRLAFLPPRTPEPPLNGSILAGKMVVPVKREGRLILRVVSDRESSVWFNQRRAFLLSPEQLPWNASSQLPPPWRTQLFSTPVQAGNIEVTVAATAQQGWPKISAQSLLTPEASDTVRINAREAAQMGAGLVFNPGTEQSPQPHIALPMETPEIAASPRQNPSAPWALYRLQLPAAGFYRLRLWCYWDSAASRGLDLILDGVLLQTEVGQHDNTVQQWHWLTAEPAAALGSETHTLVIRGWKPGTRLGIIEVFPTW